MKPTVFVNSLIGFLFVFQVSNKAARTFGTNLNRENNFCLMCYLLVLLNSCKKKNIKIYLKNTKKIQCKINKY